jgi:hypothetical protein
MATKCPACGAVMGNNTCSYCGYTEYKDNNSKSNVNNTSQQPTQTQFIQPQIIINNNPMNYNQAPKYNPVIKHGVSKKSKIVALILCIFLGGLGAHKFYVGKIGMGILYLLTFGLFGIGWLIDIILIAKGTSTDKFGLQLRE